jgi:hypothetical protein
VAASPSCPSIVGDPEPLDHGDAVADVRRCVATFESRAPARTHRGALLGRILDELAGYRAEQEPLTAWLDAVVDRYAEDRSPRSLGTSG